MLPSIDRARYLAGLNEQQHQAVTHDPNVPLQILAGPGSGKTRVVASRIAHLIDVHSVAPADIVSVTFTNKAAAEMRSRLELFVGPERTDKLVLGTFHSVCVRYLRPYHKLVGLPQKFVIQDQDDCHKQIKALCEPHRPLLLQGGRLKNPVQFVQSQISKAKAKNLSPQELRQEALSEATGPREENQLKLLLCVADIYEQYKKGLEDAQALDFDDILLKALQLFRDHGERVLANVKHVFIDEFQDTNKIQYLLARYFARSNAITIVGDPDQSIYGWRSAEVENLQIMKEDFASARQVLLEQNYRSTAAILRYGLAIIEQDNSRIRKDLVSMRGTFGVPVQRQFCDRDTEVGYIAKEIKRLKYSFGLDWADFCILLRFNAESRAFETALTKEGIPYKVLNGRRFFQRAEVMLIIAYLQLLANENFSPAFERIINVPTRGIGPVTIGKIQEVSRAERISPVEVIRSDHIPFKSTTAQFKTCREFVKVFDKLLEMANSGTSVTDLIKTLLVEVDIQGHLERTQPDHAERWQNVLELQQFTATTEKGLEATVAREQDDVVLGEQSAPAIPLIDMTPLQRFLQQTSLVSDVAEESDDGDKSSVLMSTIHQAKGLEWPVVFMPSMIEGTMPSFMAKTDKEYAEERRLFYVACTRAEALLYVTHYSRKAGFDGGLKDCAASRFLPAIDADVDAPPISTLVVPKADEASRRALHTFLGRPLPDNFEFDVLDAMSEHKLPEQPGDAWYGVGLASPSPKGRSGHKYSSFSHWASTEDDIYKLPPMPPSRYGSRSRSPSPNGFAPASQLWRTGKQPAQRSTKPPALGRSGVLPAAQLLKQVGPAVAASSSSRPAAAATSRSSSASPPPPSTSARTAPKPFAGPPLPKINSSMRRGPAPVTYKRPTFAQRQPAAKVADPPTKWAPKQAADRFTLPPMDALTSRSADPSVVRREQPNLGSLAALAGSDMDKWKSIGLPPSSSSSSSAPAPARASSSSSSASAQSEWKSMTSAAEAHASTAFANRPRVRYATGQAAPFVLPSAARSSTVSSADHLLQTQQQQRQQAAGRVAGTKRTTRAAGQQQQQQQQPSQPAAKRSKP